MTTPISSVFSAAGIRIGQNDNVDKSSQPYHSIFPFKIEYCLADRNPIPIRDYCTIENEKFLRYTEISLPFNFTPQDWKRFFGDPGDVEGLPQSVSTFLMSPSPLDPAKTVAQTSTLVFIPSKINGVHLNFKSLKILFDSAISSSINIVDDHPQIEEGYEDSPVKKSYWILMTNGVIPYSRGKILKDRVDILEAPYQAPNVLEAICVIAANILKKQTQFFSSFPLEFTFTACEETIYEKPHNHKRCIRVGGTHLRISTGQTIIHRSLTDYYGSQSTGIAGVIRL